MNTLAIWIYRRHPHRFAMRAPMDYDTDWHSLPHAIKSELRGTAGMLILYCAWGMSLCALGFFALGLTVGWLLCR